MYPRCHLIAEIVMSLQKCITGGREGYNSFEKIIFMMNLFYSPCFQGNLVLLRCQEVSANV